MDDVEGTFPTDSPLSPNERKLLQVLADHYCGAYFVRTLEGFVHNLNSPLQVLWIRSEQLQQDVRSLQKELKVMDGGTISEIAERMEQRISSLDKGMDQLNKSLNFLTKDIITKQRSEVGPVDINEAVRDTFFTLKADMFFKHQVESNLALHDELRRVKGRHSDFCVIVLHLIQNALEAMTQCEAKHLHVETDMVADQIVLRVRDSGVGISAEISSRVFEPYFTTKQELEYGGHIQEHGGLGLALVSYLLEQYNGKISFASKPSETTFTIRLPVF